ncbi:MAG: TonB-dependent receptor [Bacteroidia bacterium]
MRKAAYVLFLIILVKLEYGQSIKIKGLVKDTTSNAVLPNALVTICKYQDSTLVDFQRTNTKGEFNFNELPEDTFKVTISSKGFGDKMLFVIPNGLMKEFDFKTIVMPPKSQSLEEVTIFAFKDPIYYKGDTLVYTADSFKVKQNANVEELLKRMPGLRVSADGKITAQGKEVNQVLVDGDEFFGSDPTMATRNLAAKSVESVQIYEKKNEDAQTSENEEETIKVLNLKLKEDAKKGYFGKISGGSDFQDFHEGELLMNKFKDKQKISVFGLGSNTPKTAFGWGDINKYGLENESNYTWNEEEEFFYSEGGNDEGIPQTLTGGVYYNDKFGTKTKINANYTFKNNNIITFNEQINQYFLEDTSYITKNISNTVKDNTKHTVNFRLDQEIDSSLKILWRPTFNYQINEYENTTSNEFYASNDTITRETDNINENNTESYAATSQFRITKLFRKKDRSLTFNHNFNLNDAGSMGKLNTTNKVYTSPSLPLTDFDQEKRTNSGSLSNSFRINFFEPLNRKIKFENQIEFNIDNSFNNKSSLNKGTEGYTILDSVYSNDFSNSRYLGQYRTKLIFESSKYKINIGSNFRRVSWINNNNFTNTKLSSELYSILPFASYNYKFDRNTRLNFRYTTNSSQPKVNQLQPLPNNSNQNFITLGNPDLKPTYDHNFSLNFNSFKPISGKNIWLGGSYGLHQNAFSTSLVYDSLGRSISTPINIDGNYNVFSWFGGNIPFFNRQLNLSLNANVNTYQNNNFINNQRNTTRNTSYSGSPSITFEQEKFEVSIGGNYSYNVPYSTIANRNNKPYSSHSFNYYFRVELWKKFFIESDGNYQFNSQRAEGYNLQYFIINASIYKNIGKLDNWVIALKGYDLMNQNISVNRQVYNNVITDTKTNIITRYFLFSLTYKFNSQNEKPEDDDF